MVGWHHQLNGHESEQTPGDTEGQGSLVCCSLWGHKELDMTATEQQQIPMKHSPFSASSSPTTTTCNYSSAFCFYGFAYSICLVSAESYVTFCVCLLPFSIFSGFFHVNHASVITSFLLLSNSPLYEYDTICIPVHQLMDIWVFSTFCL